MSGAGAGHFCTEAVSPAQSPEGKQQLLGVCASTQPTLLGKRNGVGGRGRMALLSQPFVLPPSPQRDQVPLLFLSSEALAGGEQLPLPWVSLFSSEGPP